MVSYWGVLIEITEEGDVTIIKDDTRSLWIYEKVGDGIILSSEPTPYIKDYDTLYSVTSKIHSANNKIEGYDYTANSKKVLGWWATALKDNKVDYDATCDDCKIEKPTLSTSDCVDSTDYFDTGVKDKCYQCMVINKKEESTINKILVYKEECAQYLG